MQKQRKKNNKDLKESKKSKTTITAMDDERQIKEFIHRLKLQRELLKNFIDPAAAGKEVVNEGQDTDTDEGQEMAEEQQNPKEHSITDK